MHFLPNDMRRLTCTLGFALLGFSPEKVLLLTDFTRNVSAEIMLSHEVHSNACRAAQGRVSEAIETHEREEEGWQSQGEELIANDECSRISLN